MSDYATSPAPKTVRLERLLPGPIDRVWAFLTDADKRRRWFAGGEMAENGAFSLFFQHRNITDETGPEKYKTAIEGFDSPCEMVRWEPPKALAFWWGEGDGKSLVTFELTEVGDKVRFVITHAELPNRDEMVDVSGGWHAHTDILEALLRDAKPKPFWANIAELERYYTALYPLDAAD
ncbi:MAG: SRPBCC family protein [Hyphomonadaceae bacterium]|nr:SRPBCC family protein [Hyphomonadaceae bacterium]